MTRPLNIGVGHPGDTGLPLFAYGLLKPGELAHESVLSGLVIRTELAYLEGASLRFRDGLPLLEVPSTGAVHGDVMWFADSELAYERVGEFEPRHHYRWVSGEVQSERGEMIPVNVLAGKRPSKGTPQETFESWSAVQDPAFAYGPHTVAALARELTVDAFPVLPGDSLELWDRFFRLQAAYLLLWSLVERYMALALGPALDPMDRVRRLEEDPLFRAAVLAADIEPGQRVVDSRDPDTTYQIRDDGSGAAPFWYAVRSNLSHRGKSAFQDGQLVQRALVDLHNSFRILLLHRLPELEHVWRVLDAESAAEGWLIVSRAD